MNIKKITYFLIRVLNGICVIQGQIYDNMSVINVYHSKIFKVQRREVIESKKNELLPNKSIKCNMCYSVSSIKLISDI